MNNPKRLLVILAAVLIIACAVVLLFRSRATPTTDIPPANISSSNNQEPNPPPPPVTKQVVAPIVNADTRVTKKPFGIYITPKNSPVQPEKFSGYHTGTDFETFANESGVDVYVDAICAGKILAKRSASGYGGVLVQSCTINNQAVTVIYGHVSLKSISKNIGDTLSQGEKIGNLGASPSETDGERKHLHLGIHIGPAVNITGYTANQSSLSGWLDYQKL